MTNLPNDPRKGDGWDDFLEDGDDVWYEAFELDENGSIDIDHYDEFGNMQELVNFVAGTGSYSDERGFQPGPEDIEDKKRELRNTVWKVPTKIEDIQEYLEEGAIRSEIDIDPNADTGWSITEEEARVRDAETKYTAHFIAYDPDEDEEQHGNFYISASWYDTPPEDINVEDVFDLEEISDNLEGR